MLRLIRPALLASLALALTACGSSGPRLGGGKEGAAQALFQATQAGSSPMSSAAGAGRRVQAAGVKQQQTELDMTVQCAKGGKVSMSFDADDFSDTTGTGAFTFNLDYDDCNQDGRNAYDGELAVGYLSNVDETGENFSLSMTLEGKLDISGEVDDFVDANITQSMDFDLSDVELGTGTVVVRLTGTIRTASGTYTYDGSPITVQLGALPAAEEPQA